MSSNGAGVTTSNRNGTRCSMSSRRASTGGQRPSTTSSWTTSPAVLLLSTREDPEARWRSVNATIVPTISRVPDEPPPLSTYSPSCWAPLYLTGTITMPRSPPLCPQRGGAVPGAGRAPSAVAPLRRWPDLPGPRRPAPDEPFPQVSTTDEFRTMTGLDPDH
jgi:hypothetical protein